jgi:hypothetical protein
MAWENKLIKKFVSDSPVVECTPVIWEGRLLVSEVWQSHFESNDNIEGKEHYVRIRDEKTGEIVSKCMFGYAYASAFIFDRTFYVFGARKSINCEGVPEGRGVYMSSSMDLDNWTEPQLVIDGECGELLWNQSVCYDGQRFVMAYETDSNVKFTIKFAISDDLLEWHKVDRAVFGSEKYVACPAIRYCNGYFYMLYLEYLRPKWWFETYVTRSKDLINWESSPHNPVIAPNPKQSTHASCIKHPCPNSEWHKKTWFAQGDNDFASREQCPSNGKECNASDPDLVEIGGKTRVYFSGGCQHWGGLLQYAEYDGPMPEFFESYFE